MRRRLSYSRRLVPILLLLAIVLTAVMAERRMTPVMAAYAQKQAEILGVDTVVRALRQTLSDQINYDQLISIQKDDSGRITFMQVNTFMMNRILADVESSVQNALRSLEGTTFDIPLGLLLGSDLFAAYGPTLSARILSIGSVRVGFDHSFQTAGINQTRHTVSMETEARIKILIPLRAEETVINTKVPMVETVIVGPIPEQFLQLDWLFRRLPESSHNP